MHDKTINLLLMWPFSEIVWQISWLSMERVGLVGMEGGTGLIIIFPWAKTVPKNERKSAKNKDGLPCPRRQSFSRCKVVMI